MKKQTWVEHIESLSGLVRPSMSGNKDDWGSFVKSHKQGCPICAARAKTLKAGNVKRERDQAMRDCGLTRCKVNGKTFWE